MDTLFLVAKVIVIVYCVVSCLLEVTGSVRNHE